MPHPVVAAFFALALLLSQGQESEFDTWYYERIVIEDVNAGGKISVRFTALDSEDNLDAARRCGELYRERGYDGVWCFAYSNARALDHDLGDGPGICWAARWQHSLAGTEQEARNNSVILSINNCPED